MTALSANAVRARKEGGIKSYLVEDNVHIFKNAQVVINGSGYAQPLTDAAGLKFAGVAVEECDNTLTGHSQGGKEIRVYTEGRFQYAASSVSQAAVGTRMYGVDDNTVDETTSNSIFVGVLDEYESATLCWVDISLATKYEAPTKSYSIVVPAAPARGGDADWAVNISGLTLAKNKSAKTANIPVYGLLVGDVITSIKVRGGVGATTAKTTTLDAKLCKVVGAAGGDTDTDLQAIDQVSKTADYKVDETKAVSGTPTVAAGEQFYFVINGTTADDDACDIVVTGFEVVVTRTIR